METKIAIRFGEPREDENTASGADANAAEVEARDKENSADDAPRVLKDKTKCSTSTPS